MTPGGVALNIARALAKEGADVALLGAIGNDIAGQAIAAALAADGIENRLIHAEHATGTYLAIEDADGDLFAGVSDLSALEALSPDRLTAALAEAPMQARLIVDANLSSSQIAAVADRSGWLAAEAVSAPKAPRLAATLARLDALFCNLSEAAALGACAETAEGAAKTLATRIDAVVFVTDGPRTAAVAQGGDAISLTPPPAPAASVTGAGDAFTAAALMALANGAPKDKALSAAITAAATLLRSRT